MWYVGQAYAQSDQSLRKSLEYYRAVKLLAEHHFGVSKLQSGCTRSLQSTLVKKPHCWQSHVALLICTGAAV